MGTAKPMGTPPIYHMFTKESNNLYHLLLVLNISIFLVHGLALSRARTYILLQVVPSGGHEALDLSQCIDEYSDRLQMNYEFKSPDFKFGTLVRFLLCDI